MPGCVSRTNHRTPPALHEAPEEPRGGRAAPTATAASQEMVPGRNTITSRLHSPRHSALQRPARNAELEHTAANEKLGTRHRCGQPRKQGPGRGQHPTRCRLPSRAGDTSTPRCAPLTRLFTPTTPTVLTVKLQLTQQQWPKYADNSLKAGLKSKLL